MTRRALLCLMAVAGTLLGNLAIGPATASHSAGGDLLPDLETREPSELVLGTVSGRRAIRLSNTVGNNHTGPLEVFSGVGDCDNDGVAGNSRPASQRIYRDGNGNGTFDRGVDTGSRTVSAGCMQYHESHAHWHLDGFSEYSLYRMGVDGRRGPLVGVSRKTSFCIADFGGRLFPQLSGSPASGYYGDCGPTSTQGLSVGWSDTYQYFLDGQAITLPLNTSRGYFCLVSTADPGNRLVETDDGDNTQTVRFTLAGTRISVQPGSDC